MGTKKKNRVPSTVMPRLTPRGSGRPQRGSMGVRGIECSHGSARSAGARCRQSYDACPDCAAREKAGAQPARSRRPTLLRSSPSRVPPPAACGRSATRPTPPSACRRGALYRRAVCRAAAAQRPAHLAAGDPVCVCFCGSGRGTYFAVQLLSAVGRRRLPRLSRRQAAKTQIKPNATAEIRRGIRHPLRGERPAPDRSALRGGQPFRTRTSRTSPAR